jgi:hypothetical protein
VHFFYEVSVPKNTAKTAPYERILPLSYGVITGVDVIIPTGHAGKAHLQILNHEFQLYPLSRNEDYHGDGSEIQFADRFELYSAPYEVKARGWNIDTSYAHVFQVGIEILLPEQLGMQTGTTGLDELQEIIGTEIGG